MSNVQVIEENTLSSYEDKTTYRSYFILLPPGSKDLFDAFDKEKDEKTNAISYGTSWLAQLAKKMKKSARWISVKRWKWPPDWTMMRRKVR